MNFVRSNNLSLKYQKLTPLGCKDIGIIKFEFVAKTQFLLKVYDIRLKDIRFREIEVKGRNQIF